MNTYSITKTKSGYIALAGRDGRLTHSTLPKSSAEEAFEDVRAGLDNTFVEDASSFGMLPDRLIAYFEGDEVDFSDIAVDVDGFGPFHRAAQLAAMKIPYGTLVTYAELAKMAGRPGAARAAGSAMARNNMPIIIPCHRVIASGGKIGGFASGLEWKRSLLQLEGVDV